MNALHTDLYQLTMAAGYFMAGKQHERATFELFIRRLPYNRNYYVAAGAALAVEYLLNLRFSAEEIAYLRGLKHFAHVPTEFFDALRNFRFTGDVFAMPEGTPVFPGEPLMTVRAPLLEAQIPETFLLATLGFQTLIASKAARIVETAGTASVAEFGTRRAHSPEAGMMAGRAAYVGGCIGTSNLAAGHRFGIPVLGTSAHSWVMSFPSELQAFRQLQRMLGESTVYLIDTYDTLEGARKAASLGTPVWGVRLDSGNLVELARGVRRILDDAGLTTARIMATSDLNEYRILEMAAAGAPIDIYGVGTDLAVSADSPSLGAVYKMVELEVSGIKRYTAKYSEDKNTMPGAKQVFRYSDHDVVTCAWECPTCPAGACGGPALLRPVILGGELVEPLPSLDAARANALDSVKKLPHALKSLFAAEESPWSVRYSEELMKLDASVRRNMKGAQA